MRQDVLGDDVTARTSLLFDGYNLGVSRVLQRKSKGFEWSLIYTLGWSSSSFSTDHLVLDHFAVSQWDWRIELGCSKVSSRDQLRWVS